MTAHKEDPWLNDESEPLNEGYYHELMDRAYIITVMIEEIIIKHSATDKHINDLAQEAVNKIMEVYSLAAKKLINYEG